MVEPANAVATLTNARKLIDEVGWVQGTFTAYDDKDQVIGYCAMGALRDYSAYCVYILEGVLNPWYNKLRNKQVRLIGWNDTPGRTKEEVLNLFDKGIEVALKKGMSW